MPTIGELSLPNILNMITENKTINAILNQFKTEIDTDLPVYKNHVYRILNYATTLDNNEKNLEKYAIAAAFHDLGIWTHNFDYLKPSIALATTYLKENNLENWTEEIAEIINNHHKITKYKGEFKTVEIFRKADWIDVINGIKKHNLSKNDFKRIQKEFSKKGFHAFLTKQWFAWFLKHPIKSLPMFKW